MPISCYKSTLEDGAAFSALINSLGGQSLYRALYGQYNYTSLVEYTYLSVSAKNEEGVVGGFVSLNDGLPGDIEPFHDFLEKIALAAPGCSVLNSLVVNFFAYNVKVCGPDAGKDILRNAFSCCPSLHYIFWLCPANAKAPPFISTYFAEAAVDNQSDLFKKNKLFMVQRDDFLPELLVREARVEDNDDLLPILQTSNPGVMDGHDDFFLADMIQAQDERNKIFVGVSGDKPVGMLATSLDVNAALISRVFDLELYSGLVSGGAELARQTQLAVLVLGESNLVSSCNLKEMSSILGGNFLDVSAFGGTATVDADRVIDAVVGMPLSASAFCFIVGYPKNEGEAKEFITTLTSHEMRLVVVEIQSHSLDADDVERPEVPGGEDHEELLLDAVEYLRSHLLRADDTEAELNPVRNVDWIKVDITESVETVGKGVGAMKKKMEEIIELHRLTLAEIGDDLDGSAVANAFAITLFCIEEGYESRSEDMLRVAFEENPSLDYCLLMLPNDVSTPAIASCMACPHVRPGVSFDQSLFLAHRDYLLANNFLQLERYTPRDQPLFEEFVGNVSGGANGVGITAAFEHSLKEADVPLSDNPSEASFIATIQGVIVGAISISRRVTTTDDIVWMRQNYLIDNVVNFERHRSRSQAMITHWVMNPIFSKSARLVLREVMRQFQKTLLYYECKGGNIPSPEALYEMIPVKPRIYVRPLIPDGISADIIAAGEIDDGKEHSNPKSSSQRKREAPLFVMTKMELINSKNLVSKRIVIVGGNSSAFSALETLCFSRDKYLSNIYYVTEMDNFRKCGEFAIDTNASERNNLRGTLSVKDFGDPTRSYLDALGIANRIIIVSGRLTDIDRKSKAIVISDDIALEYDVLVIASASQGIISGTHTSYNFIYLFSHRCQLQANCIISGVSSSRQYGKRCIRSRKPDDRCCR